MLAASTRQSLEAYLQFICKDLFVRQGNICQPYLLFQRTHLYPVTTEAVPDVNIYALGKRRASQYMLSNSDLKTTQSILKEPSI